MRVRCAYVCPSREYSLRVVFSVRRADVSRVVWRRVTCLCVRAEWPWASVRVRGTLRDACGQGARAELRSPLPAAPRGVSRDGYRDYRTFVADTTYAIRRIPPRAVLRAISDSDSSFSRTRLSRAQADQARPRAPPARAACRVTSVLSVGSPPAPLGHAERSGASVRCGGEGRRAGPPPEASPR